MSTLKAIRTQTPFGEFHMITRRQQDKDIVLASGFGDLATLRGRLPASLSHLELSQVDDHPYAIRINRYFKGDLEALNDIPYDQVGGVFYQKIWQTMRSIRPGHTLSYKELAERADRPTAVRAAGTACGKNLIILIVPCHRIIKSSGELGNYVYGPEIKKGLLAHEANYQTTID